MTLSDFGSALIVLASAFFIFMASFVIVKHVRQWRKAKRGLLPAHIWALALSHLLLVLVGLMNVRYDQPIETTGRLIALTLGVWGMYVLVTYQKNRD